MLKRIKKPSPADLLADVAMSLETLIRGYDERISDLECRVEGLETKNRALRNRAPLKELDKRLRDAEIRLYQIERASRGYPKPPVSGSAADN